MMQGFITGSHVYGEPGADSDIDLVMMVDVYTERMLRRFSKSRHTVRFGKLNLILCSTETELAAWKVTTDRLKKIKSETGEVFDKEKAHAEFEKDRQAVGIEYKGDSGDD